MIIFRFFVAVFAVLLMVFGLIVFVTPTPLGLIMILMGFVLLASVAPDFVRHLRVRWRWLDRRIRWFEDAAPEWLVRPLRRSDPPEEDDAEDTNEDVNEDETNNAEAGGYRPRKTASNSAATGPTTKSSTRPNPLHRGRRNNNRYRTRTH